MPGDLADTLVAGVVRKHCTRNFSPFVARHIERRRGVSPGCGRAHRLQRRAPLPSHAHGLHLRRSTNCYKLSDSFPVVVVLRSGAGGMPWRLSMFPTVWSLTVKPQLASAPAI